jgi:small subunit ribosomal protein S2
VFKKYIEDLAGKQLGMPYVSEKWFGGLLTNFVTIRKTIKQIDILQNIVNNNNNSLTKKEIERRKREYNSKKKILEGILNMYKIPAAIIVVNVKYNSKAVNEAKLRGIPIIGLVDTNSDPSKIDYVIPTNDESLDSVKLILDEL